MAQTFHFTDLRIFRLHHFASAYWNTDSDKPEVVAVVAEQATPILMKLAPASAYNLIRLPKLIGESG